MKAAEDKLSLALRAVADPARRGILEMLREKGKNSIGKPNGLCAGDIEQRLGLAQPTVSHHMQVLRKAGLVEATKVATFVWYRRNESAIRELRKDLGAL